MMLTRCPACQTVFRLRPEQLHARRGEVRCGHCFHPFNALDNTVEVPDDAPPAPPAPAPRPARTDPLLDFDIPEVAPARPIRAPAPTAYEDDDWLLPAATEHPASAASVMRPAPAPEATPRSEFATRLEAAFAAAEEAPEPARAFPEVVRSGRRGAPAEPFAATEPFAALETVHSEPATQIPEPVAPPAAAAPAPRVRHAPAPPDDLPPLAAEPDLAHLDATYGRPPTATRPLLRMLAALVVLALGSLLAVQAGYLYRKEIARMLPGLRPLLSAACARAGCTVPYPRDAELIAIESSDLQAEPGRPGHYLLQATLNNRADYPQQWPHLELTLTDAGDNPLARRVLPPADWQPATQAHEAFTARNAIELRIPFAAPGVAPTGYRIYAFYP
ncbi:DUF3426 domain-containing protein [Thauera sp.]|jgi:predicted Zn finger-like uncharacterized protein|uniref:DUF3426 domain-containing protein n=1 Tax=Thauera sp. TaxID=1905334 RepID=UPI0026276F62|nr:DUF3426 domain-containing protein [Thauera sp.]